MPFLLMKKMGPEPPIQMRTKTRDDQFDLEYFFELSPDLICIVGFDGYFKKINPAVATTLGYPTSELLNSPVNTFIHPGDRELAAKTAERLRRGETVLSFENRFIAKDKSTVWLFWTAVPVERDNLIFAIAKNVTSIKKTNGVDRVAEIISQLNTEQMKMFAADIDIILPVLSPDDSNLKWIGSSSAVDQKDQLWLNRFEMLVRQYAAVQDISLKKLSSDMACSQRQLFRQVQRILGTTPNKLVRTIRLHLAWEAISYGKYRTISEIAAIAGYTSTAHFKTLFHQVYGIDISELL